MAKKSGFRKTLKTILIVLVSLVVLIGGAGLAVYNFVIIPKFNQYIDSGDKSGEKLTNKDIIVFAKYLTDKQVITNLTSIDKDTAKDLLSTMLEIEEEFLEEMPEEGTSEETQPPTFFPVRPEAFSNMETIPLPTPAPTPKPTPFVPPEIPEELEVTEEQQSAYDRIMANAKKEEIVKGLEIISKIDIPKVVDLNNKGKTAELKRYLKSVLTSKEISTSLSLYRKYKHLL